MGLYWTLCGVDANSIESYHLRSNARRVLLVYIYIYYTYKAETMSICLSVCCHSNSSGPDGNFGPGLVSFDSLEREEGPYMELVEIG